jgi:thiamine biosynthesis lipoprotein
MTTADERVMNIFSMPRVTRRRFIHISAAAAGLSLLPASSRLLAATGENSHLQVWRGVALGADAMLQINHPDRQAAGRLIARCLAEVSRLERIFSLYVEDSAIRRLNRDGRLPAPPLEFVELLGQAAQFGRLTGGAFDATVQPLWALYAAHFSKPSADPAGPARSDIAAALRRVGFEALELDPDEIRFARPRMAVTLNGIAQGYITDRIVALLRGFGIDRSLVDMGETRAIGGRPAGGPWIVGLEDPIHPGEVAERIAIDNLAVATSGGYGTLFDPAGRFNHILDPATGGTSSRYLSVSVVAPTATVADALSTAFSLMPLDATRRVAETLGIRAHFALADGSRLTQGKLPA